MPIVFVVATHVALTFAADTPLPRRILTTAVAEAARIWSPYHVVVDEIPPCGSAPDEAIVLTVCARRSPSHAPAGALGAIVFGSDGQPGPLVTVFLDLLIRLLAKVQIWQVSEDRWPGALRDLAVGRAVGRVIAHEIGHYLLASGEHSTTGLMRAVHRADELFEPARGAFVLAPSQARRLAAAEQAGAR